MPPHKPAPRKQDFLKQQGALNPRPQTVTAAVFQNSDFFDSRDLVQVKYEMLRRVEIEEQRVSHAAREFGFSRPSFYQAQAAFEQGGLTSLFPQKRGPREAHKLSQEVMQFVEEARAAQPALRWSELAQRIHQRFGLTVHPRSIERGLARWQKKRR